MEALLTVTPTMSEQLHADFEELLGDDQLADDGEVTNSLVELHRLRSRVDAAIAALTHHCDVRCIPQQHNKRNTTSLLAGKTNIDPHQLRADARNGNWLIDYPELNDAFVAGAITSRHVDLMRRAQTPKTQQALFRDQAMIVNAAATLSFVDFKSYIVYWQNAADPDGTLPKEQTDRTRLAIHRDADGTVRIKGTFDPLAGAIIYGAIEDEAQRELQREKDGDQPLRTVAKRRADALTALVRRGYDNPDAGVREPLLSIVMSLDVAEQALARLDDPDVDVELRWDDIDGRCELLDGTPIHPDHALAVFGRAILRRFVFDADSRIIDVSYNSRSFPAWIKHAARVASRGRCTTAGCDAPFAWLQTDHIDPHSRGGPTKFSNSQPKCDADNRFKRDKTPDSRFRWSRDD